jgi:ribosomal protein S27AE
MRLSVSVPVHNAFPLMQKPACPKCGDLPFAATAMDVFDQGHVRHYWSCDRCDFKFSTDFDLPPAA